MSTEDTKKETDYITNFEWKTSNFYVLPKIHKNKIIIENSKMLNDVYIEMEAPPDLKGRPIVAGSNSPTSRLSELLEKILTPLVKNMQSYIKDDRYFLRKLPREITYDCDLYSFDIVSLYTSISHDLGIQALKYWINKYRQLIPERFTHNFIEEACLFILTNKIFKFDIYFFRQLIGTI